MSVSKLKKGNKITFCEIIGEFIVSSPLEFPCCTVWLCFGKIQAVIMAVENNSRPSVANGKK